MGDDRTPSQAASDFVQDWNAEKAADFRAHQSYATNPTSIVADGKFGMDGYLTCGGVIGALFGGLSGGWLGAVVGGIVGFLLVVITLGPMWYWWTKYRGWNDEKRAVAARALRGERVTYSPTLPKLPTLPRLPLPTSAKAWTLGGLVCGAAFGMMFTQLIDLAEEMLRGAIYFGIAGAVAGYSLRWVGMRILRR